MRNYNTKEFKELISQEGLVLVDFFATWCGPCKMLAPVLEELQEELKNDVTIAKIDVDEESELAAEYRISSIPTLVLLKNGKPVDSAIGYRDVNFLAEMVKKQK
ncbi:MAG: thioredoxin [Bacilli bacterium]|nr:thioredoxin [Bacilli bacterium]